MCRWHESRHRIKVISLGFFMHIWYKKSILLVTTNFLIALGVRFLCCFIKWELHVELFCKIHNGSFRNYLMQKMIHFSTYHNMPWDVINVPPNITILRFLRHNIFKTVRWILTRLQTNHILPKIKYCFYFFFKILVIHLPATDTAVNKNLEKLSTNLIS